MTIHGQDTFNIQGEEISKVEHFKFLGSMITAKGDSTTDINVRLATAKTITSNLKPIWQSSNISIKTKVRLAKSLVWSVALYGCESWTLRKEDERKLTSFEMWLWRRVLRISWIERKSNSWVREKVKITEDNGMLAHVKHRKISKYCHWKRRPSSLVLTTIEGKTPGKGKRGRRRYKWLDNILTWSGESLYNIGKKAINRETLTVRNRTIAEWWWVKQLVVVISFTTHIILSKASVHI